MLAGEVLAGESGVADGSVQETLARVAAFPPGPQPIRWLTSLDGCDLSAGEALELAGAWERQARWVTARQQAAWVGFAGPVGPGPLGPDGPTETQLRQEHSNLLELALTIDCGVDFTRDQLDQARLLTGTLSATRDRLATGELSAYRARRIAEELRTLDPVTAQRSRAKVLDTAGTVRVPSLVRKLRRLVLAAQGPAAVQAHQAGAAQRRVVVDTEAAEIGLLGLHAYLPPEQTIAIRELLETKAKELARADRAARDEVKRLNRQRAAERRHAPTRRGRARRRGRRRRRCSDAAGRRRRGQTMRAGDGGLLELPVRRSKDQRMADALAILLLGADETEPPRPVKPAVAVQVTVDLPTLVHLRQHPGELLGYGPIPADIARELAGDAAWQRFVHEPVTGYLLDAGDERYQPPPAITRLPGSPRRPVPVPRLHPQSPRRGRRPRRTAPRRQEAAGTPPPPTCSPCPSSATSPKPTTAGQSPATPTTSSPGPAPTAPPTPATPTTTDQPKTTHHRSDDVGLLPASDRSPVGSGADQLIDRCSVVDGRKPGRLRTHHRRRPATRNANAVKRKSTAVPMPPCT